MNLVVWFPRSARHIFNWNVFVSGGPNRSLRRQAFEIAVVAWGLGMFVRMLWQVAS